MANEISHPHLCFECGKEHICDYPECATLTGFQRLCQRCSYLYGWRQSKERRTQDDYNVTL